MPTIIQPCCHKCKKSLPSSAPRVFWLSRWWCEDCLYKEEVDPKPVTKPKIGRPKWPQKEKLWDNAL